MASVHFVVIALAFAGACNNKSGPVVTVAEEPVSPSAVEADKTTTTHPEDAVSYGGHRYKVYDEMISWHDAQAKCKEMGGYLCCIGDAEEQAFLAELANGHYLFLGATDEKEEGTFVWVDGSEFDFTSWYDGQPNNYCDEEHYLATYDGGDWVDVAVEGEDYWMPTGFVCEWDE